MSHTIVILGAGYGGLTALNHLLAEELPENVKFILIDRNPFQALKTEFYALAAGTIAESHIRVHFPKDPRLEVKYGDVTDIQLEEKTIFIKNSDPVSFDTLIIGLGCTDKYHGIEGAGKYTQGIQSLPAVRQTYQAVNNLNPYSNVTIVGGGLSGVEVASELRESRPDLNICILDRGSSVLTALPKRLQRYVHDWFEEHEVRIHPQMSVTKVEPGVVYTQDKEILSDEIIWTAGIQPNEVVQSLHLNKDRSGRLIVNEYHQIPQYPNVYVVGDCASLPYTPSAQLAEEQGKQIAEVLVASFKEETPLLGPIRLKGVLGSLGKKSGFGYGMVGKNSVMLGRVPRLIKSGVLWISKLHGGS